MLNFYTTETTNAIPIVIIFENEFENWCSTQTKWLQQFVAATNFTAKAGTFRYLSDAAGNLSQILLGFKTR